MDGELCGVIRQVMSGKLHFSLFFPLLLDVFPTTSLSFFFFLVQAKVIEKYCGADVCPLRLRPCFLPVIIETRQVSFPPRPPELVNSLPLTPLCEKGQHKH